MLANLSFRRGALIASTLLMLAIIHSTTPNYLIAEPLPRRASSPEEISEPLPIPYSTPIVESYCRLNSNFINDTFFGNSVPYVPGSSGTPGCVSEMFNQAWAQCSDYLGVKENPSLLIAMDDCVAYKIFGARVYNYQNYVGINEFELEYLNTDRFGAPFAWASVAYRNTVPFFATCHNSGPPLKSAWVKSAEIIDYSGRSVGENRPFPVGRRNFSEILNDRLLITQFLDRCRLTYGTSCGYYNHDSVSSHGNLLKFCAGYAADVTSHIFIRTDSSGSCSAVSSVPAEVAVCNAGTYYWYQSPISLLWDGATDVEQELRFSKFPIDPKKPNAVSVWKASAKTPLLVYDPEHKGIIKNSFQLLGNWAFGGKPLASIKSHITTDIDKQNMTGIPWANGYEALGSLDTNLDGKVRGNEIEPLALWFDANRDGVSDIGEVKRLADVGVKELYYRVSRQEKLSRSLFADYGYQRDVNGNSIIGASVDWWSDTADTEAELINKHLAASMACPTVDFSSVSGQQIMEFEIPPEQITTYSQGPDSISGLWEWSPKDKNSNLVLGGYLGFKELDGKKVQGHSYGTFPAQMRGVNGSMLSAIVFSGTKKVRADGSIEVQFNLIPDKTSRLENIAIFYPRQNKIYGKTFARVSLGTKAQDLRYTWIAKRLQSK